MFRNVEKFLNSLIDCDDPYVVEARLNTYSILYRAKYNDPSLRMLEPESWPEEADDLVQELLEYIFIFKGNTHIKTFSTAKFSMRLVWLPVFFLIPVIKAAEALKLPTLTSFILGNSARISDESAKELAHYLKNTNRITSLEMKNAPSAMYGYEILAEAIGESKSITEFIIGKEPRWEHDLSEEGAQHFVTALEKNVRLLKLEINSKEISPQIKARITALTKRNQQLAKLCHAFQSDTINFAEVANTLAELIEQHHALKEVSSPEELASSLSKVQAAIVETFKHFAAQGLASEALQLFKQLQVLVPDFVIAQEIHFFLGEMLFGNDPLNELCKNNHEKKETKYRLIALLYSSTALTTDNLKIILACVAKLQNKQTRLYSDDENRLKELNELLGAEQLIPARELQKIVAEVLADPTQDNTLLKQVWQADSADFNTKFKVVVEHTAVRQKLTASFGTHRITCLEDVILHPKQYPMSFLSPTPPFTLATWEQQAVQPYLRELRAAHALQRQQAAVVIPQPNTADNLIQSCQKMLDKFMEQVLTCLIPTNPEEIEVISAESEQSNYEPTSLNKPVAELPNQNNLAEKGISYAEAWYLITAHDRLRLYNFFHPDKSERNRIVCKNLYEPGLNDQDRYQVLQDYMNDPRNRNDRFYKLTVKTLGEDFFLEKKDNSSVAEKDASSPRCNK